MVLHTQPDRYRTRLTDGICVRAHIARSIENDVTLSFRTAFSSSSFFRLEELTESHLELPKVRCTLQRERERSSPEHVLVLFYFLLSCPLSAGPMGCKEIWGHRRERKELEEEGTWPEWPKLFRRLLSSLFLDTINCQSRGSPVVDGNCFPIQDWRPHTHRSPLPPTNTQRRRAAVAKSSNRD